MIHKKTLMAVGLIGATPGLNGLANANSPPPPVHRFDWTLTQAQRAAGRSRKRRWQRRP